LLKPNRSENLQKLALRVETDILLLGCTAIEDKLQPNVPATIRKFLEIDIKVWMITGDKLETAENIALSCGITNPSMNLFTLKKTQKSEISQEINDINSQILTNHSETKKGIIVEMGSLDFIFQNKDLETSQVVQSLTQLLLQMDSVVCCRATPKQKAKLVKMVKTQNLTVLAVGDGANDVNMINEANVGIGIYGQEGLNAVHASDYGIGEFQVLSNLLLVHGRWCNFRNSLFIRNF
jgi:magnesium-transporting ATPase (P-type)